MNNRTNVLSLCRNIFQSDYLKNVFYMVVVVEKKYDRQKIGKLMDNFKPSKIFNAKQFAGKITWEEDPCEFQKRMRNEWN